jgi:hypothetical protein
MSARQAYYEDLLEDCMNAVIETGIPEEHQGVVIAALIQSDSYNGMRKAILHAAGQLAAREPRAGDML